MRVRPPKAFTLIELLVVISIIALLIGILLPSLGKARKSALSLQCATKMQQIGRAIAIYQNDFDSYYPSPREQLGGGGQLVWDDQLVNGSYDGRNRGNFDGPAPLPGGIAGALGFAIPSTAPAASDPGNALYLCPLLANSGFNHAPGYAPATPHAERSYSLTDRFVGGGGGVNQRLGVAGWKGTTGPAGPIPGGQQASTLRADDIFKSSGSLTLVENGDARAVGAGRRINNILGGVPGSTAWGGLHSPWAAGGQALVRSAFHHSTAENGPGVASAKYTPNYLFGDSHVASIDTLDTYEDETNGGINNFDTRRTMWDATRR